MSTPEQVEQWLRDYEWASLSEALLDLAEQSKHCRTEQGGRIPTWPLIEAAARLTAFEASRAAPDDGLEALRELLDEHDKACGATKYEPSTQRPAAMHMYELQRQTFAAMYAYVRNKLAQEPRS